MINRVRAVTTAAAATFRIFCERVQRWNVVETLTVTEAQHAEVGRLVAKCIPSP
jgi:hypothetical protein